MSDGTVGGDVGVVERERERGGYYLVSDGTVGGDVGAVEREREREVDTTWCPTGQSAETWAR